ncbi:integrase, catalytic region, zinc finger, CCHC-type containing protein [Tanacetum coccineum]|uniref:Integrase, catalytic region, zinc finger, CCHC-type containing protein n=1 Tax=Tanacetum coccineum TaxID=301880 RepID=A0ABQ5GYW4_9ASTR
MENEIDLEKKIKELDNIVYKVGQSAQTVHMLTKTQAFYDNTHKQALGYQNPFYLRKAQRIKPTLYDGAVISKTHVAMPVIDEEETLILEEESRSKMFEKAKDPEVIAKKISHKPIDYEKLNSLIEDFETRFSPQQELSAEQAFWFHTFNPTIEPSYSPPVIVDVPNKLPKVSLVNASYKKLKFHLTQYDSMVKKRTTPSALEEGEWGFEHTKAIFNNEIIPFLKSLKDIFNVFDKDLLNEITEVQTVFDQMEASVQQFSVDKKCLEIAKKEILLENDRLLQKVMSQDVLITVMNSMSLNNDSVNVKMQKCELCEKCLNLNAELSKSKQAYNDLLKNHSQLEKHCISLEVSMQLKQEVFQNDESCVNQNAVKIQECFEINDLKAWLQDKDTTISKLKDTIKYLTKNTKEKNVNHDKCDLEPINEELENRKEIVENVVHIPSATTIAPGMFKLDLVPLPHRLLENREVHIDYLRNTKKQANILQEIVKQAKAKQPLDGDLDLACKYATRIQELLVYVQDTYLNAITPSTKKVAVTPMNNVKKVRFAEPLTSSSNIKQVESSNTSDSNTPMLYSTGVKCSTSNCGSKPPSNKKNDRISQTPSRNKKNKVEAQPRKVVQIILWYLDSGCSKHMTGNRSQLMNFVSKFLGTIRFRNDQIARINGDYGDISMGKKLLSQGLFNYIEGLDINLFFWSRDTNLYTISLDDMLKSSPICLLSKASKTKSWLWHRRLSHLNFGTLNKLAKDGIARGIPRLKFQKDHLCSTCALGKSKKTSHQPKEKDTNQEKLYLLHMDLCGLMRVASITGKSPKVEELLGPSSKHQKFQVRVKATVQRNVHESVMEPEFGQSETGFVDLDNPSHVYKLNKALYGLKQAPRTWYDMLSSFLISQQFSKGAVDFQHSSKRHVGNDILLVQIYVDDIIFASTNTAMCNEFANQMTSKFKMSMMGHMSFFLGLQISQSPGGVFINQSKYASEIVKKYGLHSTDSIDTPMIENKKLDEDLQGKPVDATLYCGIIGSLMYLTSSRPDLNYVVCLCAPG